MYRGVLKNSKKVDQAAEDFVTILCFDDEAPKADIKKKSFDRARGVYLPKFFLCPTYLFLDPEGNRIAKKFTSDTHHKMLTEDVLADKLDEIKKKFKEIVPRIKWLEVKKKIKEAGKLLDAGDFNGALRILEPLIDENELPLLTEKAKRLRHRVYNYEFLKSEIEGIKKQAKILELIETVRKYGDQPEGKEARKELKKLGIKRIPRKSPTDDRGKTSPKKIYLKAVEDTLSGKIVSAISNLSDFLKLVKKGRFRKHRTLYKRLVPQLDGAFSTGRTKIHRMKFDSSPDLYWEIAVTVGTEFELTESLTIQYAVMTVKGKVFAGYQTFGNVKKSHHHRHMAYLPINKLSKPNEKIKMIHFEVYAKNILVASSHTKGRKWWRNPKAGTLIFVDSFGWLWDSGTLKATKDKGRFFIDPSGKGKPAK